MKKLTALILALALSLSLCACGQKTEETVQAPAASASASVSETASAPEAAPAEQQELVMGTLSLLNMTEEEYLIRAQGKQNAIAYLVEQGVYHSDSRLGLSGVVFYDTLDAMLMALEAGDISVAEMPVCTADYLCAHNDKLAEIASYDLSGTDEFTKQVAYRLGEGFSFLTTEDKAELRDELDQALTEMKDDGTLDALIQSYITDAVNGEPQPVEFTQVEGETIKVAITGALPPMDYVASDGTPAGFNTALLAELGRRLNVNFDLVQVDSIGRAAALASGQVDLVFWNNGSDGRSKGGRQTLEEHDAYVKKEMSDSQHELMHSISGGFDYERTQNYDIPDSTITTQPYFSDLLIPVALK